MKENLRHAISKHENENESVAPAINKVTRVETFPRCDVCDIHPALLLV